MVSFQQHMEHILLGSSAGRAFRDFHLPRLLQGGDSQCRPIGPWEIRGDRHDFLHEKWRLWGDHEDFMSVVFLC